MRVRVVGRPDPSFAWDGRDLVPDRLLEPGAPMPAAVSGTLASVRGAKHTWRLTRDPLGLNKLFWARESADSVLVSTRPYLLVGEGVAFEEIRSLPRGCVVDVTAGEVRTGGLQPAAPVAVEAAPEAVAAGIRATLDGYLAALAAANPHARAVVCCSGGLDSSGILALATRHFPDVVGISFDFDRPGGRPSEDRVIARRLCRDLRVDLVEANVVSRRILDHLDTVLRDGVDWRDFNVHAALVNAVLAEAVAESGVDRPMVFTGDLANELLADYHDEVYRGVTYYRLPRIPPVARRRWLVTGLDSTNREVGVFGAWGVPLVQPYAAATELYLRLPGDFLAREDAKQHLCRTVFGDVLPDYILHRVKVRAQIGDPDTGGGVLATCIDHGVDQAALRARFAELHKVDGTTALDQFIRAGRYRSAVPEETS